MPAVTNNPQNILDLSSLITNGYFISLVRIAILVMVIFYAIFSLLIVRQVDLMSKTFHTRLTGIIKALAILHAGFVIGFIFLFWGML